MPQTTIGANLQQSLDVHRHFATQVTLYFEAAIYDLTEATKLTLSEILDASIRADIRLRENVPTARPADTVDIGESDFDTLALR